MTLIRYLCVTTLAGLLGPNISAAQVCKPPVASPAAGGPNVPSTI